MSNQSRREALRRQREAEAAAARKKKMTIIGAGIVAFVLVVVGAVWLVFNFKDQIGATNAVPANANGDKSGIRVEPNKARQGAVTVVVYQDYQCPFCKLFEQAFSSKLEAAANAGTIQLEYRTMTFLDANLRNDASTRAAVGAACADNAGVYLDYHDAVYANQPTSEGAGYSDDLLRVQIPTQIGLSGDKLAGFQKCYDTKATLQFVNSVDQAAGRAGITSTPTYVIGGTDVTKQLDYNTPTSIDRFLPTS